VLTFFYFGKVCPHVMKAIINTGFNCFLVCRYLRYPLIGFVHSPALNYELFGVLIFYNVSTYCGHRGYLPCPFVLQFWCGLCQPIFELHQHTFGVTSKILMRNSDRPPQQGRTPRPWRMDTTRPKTRSSEIPRFCRLRLSCPPGRSWDYAFRLLTGLRSDP